MARCVNKIRVRYQETDRMGIVYHSNYFIWFEIGRTELFRKLGVSYRDIESGGRFLAVTEARCDYKAPATYDDELEITTLLSEVKRSVIGFEYEIRKDGGIITTGSTKHAFLDAKGRPVKIPEALTDALKMKE